MMFSLMEGGKKISIQNPMPTDGDSLYNKDINFDLSAIGTFTGDLSSIFGDYQSEIVDSTATNPKHFTIALERPVTSNKIGIGSKTGDFSNVSIFLKDLAGTTRQYFDDSADATKHTSNVYEFTSNTFIEIRVEFHTADEVKVSGMFVPKSQERHISAIDGIISVRNSSLVPLAGGAVFTGEQEDTKNYGMIQCALYSDVACNFKIFFRSTPSSIWRLGDTYDVEAGEDKVWSFQSARRLMRVIVTNGPGAQGAFDLQTILKPVYVKPSSHPIGGVIKGNDDAELVKAQITGERPDGDYGNVAVTNGNNLKISLEEFDDVANPVRKDMQGGGKIAVGTTAIEAGFTGGQTYSIIITADHLNTGILYIGESNVTSAGVNALTFIEAGESVTIDFDDTDIQVYVVSDTAGQNFFKGALL